MAIKHSVVKAPGQRVFAVTDWNADHVVDGNTGEVLFLTAGGNVGTDPDFFWDDVNKRLGIGIAAPTADLHVADAGDGYIKLGDTEAWQGRIQYDSSANTILYFDSTFDSNLARTQFRMRTHGVDVDALTILGSGNVGIGTTAPENKLHIVNVGQQHFMVDSYKNEIEFYKDDPLTRAWGIGMSVATVNLSDDFIFTSYNGAVWDEKVRITNVGLVGIGTSSPNYKLQVNTGTDENFILRSGSDYGAGYTGIAISSINDANSAAEMFVIGGDPIIMTANVGIGSTLPQGLLHVGDQATNYLKVKADGEIELVGTARVVNHVVIHAETFKLIGAKPAVVNSEGIFITLDFVHTAEKEAYAANFIPFRWDSDTDIEMRLDWLTDADGTGGDVVWGIEYLSIKDNEAVAGATTTITEAFTGAGAGLLQRSTFTTKLLKGNLQADDIIGIRVFRDHDAGGDTLDLTARFLALHLHFIRNKIGEAT